MGIQSDTTLHPARWGIETDKDKCVLTCREIRPLMVAGMYEIVRKTATLEKRLEVTEMVKRSCHTAQQLRPGRALRRNESASRHKRLCVKVPSDVIRHIRTAGNTQTPIKDEQFKYVLSIQ